MALDRGYFREAGLDVSSQRPSDPSAPIKEVAAGRADLAISYEPEVLLARDQGLPVKAVAALVHRPLTSLIWLKDSGIGSIKDLRGKTIATAGIPYQDAYLKTILARAGLTPERRRGRRRPARPAAGDPLRPRRRDAGRVPQRRGGRPEAARQGPDRDPGRPARMPTYDELVLVANSDALDDDPRGRSSSSSPRLSAARSAAAADPAGATRRSSRRPGPRPEDNRGRGEATLPLL